MKRLILLGMLAVPFQAAAQDAQWQDFAFNMGVPIINAGIASEAVACGLRPQSFLESVNDLGQRGAQSNAERLWPAAPQTASVATDAARNELLGAEIANTSPAPDECDVLASMGWLASLDKVLSLLKNQGQ